MTQGKRPPVLFVARGRTFEQESEYNNRPCILRR
jgi:hypothetical protein